MPTFYAYIMFYTELFSNSHLEYTKPEFPKCWTREAAGYRALAGASWKIIDCMVQSSLFWL